MRASFLRLPELYLWLGNLADEMVAEDASAAQRDLRVHGQKKTKEMHQAVILVRAIQGMHGIEPMI